MRPFLWGFSVGRRVRLRLPALHTCRTFIVGRVSVSAPAAYRMTIFESNLPSHRALLTQMLRVETQMLFNKRGDKIIAVVVTRLHTQR